MTVGKQAVIESGLGQHRLIWVQSQSLDRGGSGKREASLRSFCKHAAEIHLIFAYRTIHGHTGYEIVGGVELYQSSGDDGFPGFGRKVRVLNFETRKRGSVHPSVEKPIERLAVLKPQ